MKLIAWALAVLFLGAGLDATSWSHPVTFACFGMAGLLMVWVASGDRPQVTSAAAGATKP